MYNANFPIVLLNCFNYITKQLNGKYNIFVITTTYSRYYNDYITVHIWKSKEILSFWDHYYG